LAQTPEDAWQALLQRPFHGLSDIRYRADNAGEEQQALYDLSLSAPDAGLNVLLLYPDEPLSAVQQQWLQQHSGRHQINAHSSAVMARLGRTVGNTMTAVQPGNLKLIGRATYLVQSHVNSVLESAPWQARHGQIEALSYAEANAILFTAIDQRASLPEAAGLPEVELSIVTALEHLSSGHALDWPGAAAILKGSGLNGYLRRISGG